MSCKICSSKKGRCKKCWVLSLVVLAVLVVAGFFVVHSWASPSDPKKQFERAMNCFLDGKEAEGYKWLGKAEKGLLGAAEQGDAVAQFMLASCYNALSHYDADSKVDFTEAVKWYRKAAKQGYAKAQALLGEILMYGDPMQRTVVEKDPVEAAEWFSKAIEGLREAAERGDMQAQEQLVKCYKQGWGVEKDEAEAAKWGSMVLESWRKKAEHGNAYAQWILGVFCRQGDYAERDTDEALKWLHKAAEQGYHRAYANLAWHFHMEENFAEAFKWFREAAETGKDASSSILLGQYYEEGKGVERNAVEAVKWYRKAAEQGDFRTAWHSLGRCYEEGIGVEKNKAEALKWYSKEIEHDRKYADEGRAWAQALLGYYYARGDEKKGIEKDEFEAFKWYRKAAEQGRDDAQRKLGDFYRDGIGVEKDVAEAVKWYRKAAKQGDTQAAEALRRLEVSAE